MGRKVENSIDDTVPSSVDWTKSITSIIENTEESERQVKKVRKMVLLSLQLDDSDKDAKKHFKKAVQNMEQNSIVKLDSDGTIHLLLQSKKSNSHKTNDSRKNKKKKRQSPSSEINDDDDDEEGEEKVKKSKKEKKQKKRKMDNNNHDDEDEDPTNPKVDGNDNDEDWDDDRGSDEEIGKDADDDKDDSTNVGSSSGTTTTTTTTTTTMGNKNKPCKGNPQGVTRLFLGNLPFAVDEASLSAFLPGVVTHIKWITDKETGKFYGSAFCEMDTSKSAAEAVSMTGSKLIGRPIKINLAPAREGDVWPPAKKVVSGNGPTDGGASAGTTGGGGGQAGGSGIKAMSAKPDNCTKLFIGNLSYEIDDEAITKFFANVDAEVKAVRWLHHKDSGDFKGVGFVEFWNTDACEKAATLNGKNLLGRPIRIDWTD